MSLQLAQGSFSTTGLVVNDTIVVSGLGFRPRALLVFGNSSNNGLGGAGAYPRCFGAAVSPTERWSTCVAWQNDTFSNVTNRTMRNDCVLVALDASPSALAGQIDVDSFDADGFTLICDAVFNADTEGEYFYLAIGGIGVRAAVGVFTDVSTNITGVGFRPDLLINSGAHAVGSIGFADRHNFGFCNSKLEQAVVMTGAQTGTASSANFLTYCRRGDFAAKTAAAANGFESRGHVTSLDADGFTMAWDTTSGSGFGTYYFLALRGVRGELGTFTTNPALNGAVTISGLRYPSLGYLTLSGALTTENAAGTPTFGTGASGANTQMMVSSFLSTTDKQTLFTRNSYVNGSGFASSLLFGYRNASSPWWTPEFTADEPGQAQYNLENVSEDGFRLRDVSTADLHARFGVFMSLSDPAANNAPFLGSA